MDDDLLQPIEPYELCDGPSGEDDENVCGQDRSGLGGGFREAAALLRELSRTLSRQQSLLKEVPSALRTEAEKLQQELRERRNKLQKRAQTLWQRSRQSNVRRRTHKLSFVVLFLNIILTSFWVGHQPQSYYVLYTVKTVLLVFTRFVCYRWQRAHYYLLDYCYFINLTLLLYIWLFPTNAILWKGLFVSSGLLSLSIYLFRNGLIPHSLDKVTSVEVHFSPLLVFWTLRWYPSQPGSRFFDFTSMEGKKATFEGTWLDGYATALALYAIWGFLYYTTIFVISARRIRTKGNMTLYQYIAFEKGILATLPCKWQAHGPWVFICGHFVLFCIGCISVPLQDQSYWLHSVMLIVTLIPSLWFGATFYMDYFARTYESQLRLVESMAKETPNCTQPLNKSD